jgi:hypothetical protein
MRMHVHLSVRIQIEITGGIYNNNAILPKIEVFYSPTSSCVDDNGTKNYEYDHLPKTAN